MKTILRWLNKKGISTDAFVIVLLVAGLAVGIFLMVYFVTHGKAGSEALLNTTTPLKEATGFGK